MGRVSPSLSCSNLLQSYKNSMLSKTDMFFLFIIFIIFPLQLWLASGKLNNVKISILVRGEVYIAILIGARNNFFLKRM